MFGSKPKHSYIDIFEGMLIGGTLVAATTFLLGTKKGKQLQRELKHKYEEMKAQAGKTLHKFERKVKRSPGKLKRAAKVIKTEAKRGAKRTAKAIGKEAHRSAKRIKARAFR